VNGVAITRDDVNAMATRMARSGDAAAMTKEALDRLILAELAYERAKAVGIMIGPADVDNAVNEIKDNVGGKDMFRQTLAEKKMTEEDFRRELERDLMIKRIYQKEVLAGIVLDPEELKQEIEKAREESNKIGKKADMRAIRRSAEKKLKTREENKRMAVWEMELRKSAKLEIMEGGDEKK
jgi:hypothetical protein